MKSSIDTNIILRYLWKDVPSQREKATALLDDETQIFHVSDMVVAEVIFNLQMDKLKRSTIVNVLNQLFEKKNIEVSAFVKAAVLPYFADHPALSFVDCYSAFEAEKLHAEPLWTFDRKLSAQHPSAKRP